MRSHQDLSYLLALFVSSWMLPSVLSLGINCQGSFFCPAATLVGWYDKEPMTIMNLLRDAVWASTKPLNTTFANGDHVICIAQDLPVTIKLTDPTGITGATLGSYTVDIPTGGICLFPQYLPQGANLTLEKIRPLMDKLIEHGCGTCGSIPAHFVDQGSNNPSGGILTFNYVHNPYCLGECITSNPKPPQPSKAGSGNATNHATGMAGSTKKRSLPRSAKFGKTWNSTSSAVDDRHDGQA